LLVGLFWLWLFVAVAIYAYRIWRRIGRGSPPSPADADGDGDAPSDLIRSARPTTAGREPTVAPAHPPAAPPVPDVERTPEPGARSGLFASAPRSGAPGAADVRSADDSPSEARPTVAQALTGISMPCDLTPVVDTGRLIDPYRVAFTTETSPAATVGAEIGDELERLGFDLTSTAANQLVATKPDTRVTVTIHTDPSAVMIAEGPAFPNARPGSLVVEFQT
jgi:hypothetical protein